MRYKTIKSENLSFTKIRSLVAGALLGVAMCSPADAAVTFLHTQGHDMVDENGQKALLQSVGLGNWMLPEGYMWKFGNHGDRPRKIEKIIADLAGKEYADRFWSEFRKNYITEADIKRIADLGFNSVRPALNARLFLSETEPPVYVDEGFELLDNLIGWCKKYDLYVIIDMHGAPGGQTGANIDDSPNDKPELFSDKKNQDRLVDLWVKIANRYKDEPAVAAYDLLNEPLPERTGAAAQYKDQLEPLYKRITKAIRKVDKKHMLTVEGTDWANDWSVFSSPPFDNNMFYQFHYYCWDKPTTLKGIDTYLEKRKQLNAPVWVGETGEKDTTIYWGTVDLFEKNNIGWSFWPWKKMDTANTPYSIKMPEGWAEIRAYSSGKDKPSPEVARKAFDQLLANIRLENCVYYPDVVNALFGRVPGKIEAENYGHEGPGKSYFIKDNAKRSKYYRTSEAVPVEFIGEPNGRRSEQAVKLNAGEWTAYTFRNLESKDSTVSINVKAESAPALIRLLIDGNAQELTATNSGWSKINLKTLPLSKGTHRLEFHVTTGSVQLDWVAVSDEPAK